MREKLAFENIYEASEEQLKNLMVTLGEKPFRGNQVYEWLHSKNINSYDEMLNVPLSLRTKLNELFPLHKLEVFDHKESNDGSKKYIFTLSDNEIVESVAIFDSNSSKRLTVCVSSQVGCPIECSFCATGQCGFLRNLTEDEIVQQVQFINKDLNSRVSNVVFMGQGEPFLNYDNVMAATRRLNQDIGLNIGARHITISTSGIIDNIYKFSEEPEQFRLAISLHSTNQDVRDYLMPNLKNQSLVELKKSLVNYCESKRRRITLEYLLFKDLNDHEEDIKALIEFCNELNVHINLLKFNPINNLDKTKALTPSLKNTFQSWVSALQDVGINCSIRDSKAQDIAGSCGQLANSIQD